MHIICINGDQIQCMCGLVENGLLPMGIRIAYGILEAVKITGISQLYQSVNNS